MDKVRKKIIFAPIFLLLIIIVLIGFFLFIKQEPTLKSGQNLNKFAWEKSFVERGINPPADGPREGYWGRRLGSKTIDITLGWHEPFSSIPGMLEIDNEGLQHYITSANDPHEILIIGASVAFGAYLSGINTTYFYKLGKELEYLGEPSNIHIIASGAWKSEQEIKAFQIYGQKFKPEVAIFLNGANDVVIGNTATTRYGDLITLPDGKKASKEYHTKDFEERVEHYLSNMNTASKYVKRWNGKTLFVLQPTLFEKKSLSKIEEKLLNDSIESQQIQLEKLKNSYEGIRQGLLQISNNFGIYTFDASNIFNDEKYTTFTDLWHFSDPGHEILGRAIAEKIKIIIKVNP